MMNGAARKVLNEPRDGFEKKVGQNGGEILGQGGGGRPVGFQRAAGRPAAEGIQHSKKEDVRSGDKLKRLIIGKERNDGGQNQDIREVSPGVDHVIKIQKIHRIKHPQGKSMDSSPQIESIILSPNQPYKSSAGSSRGAAQLP